LIGFLFFLGFLGYFGYRRISLNRLRKRIRELAARKKVLRTLMKKNQIERFKENKVSDLLYNIKIKKYREKLNEIEQELPVLENKMKNALRNSF
jgi:hypothetical protein